jgi:hypothetical protein
MKPRPWHALSSAVVCSLLVLALASGAFAYGHDNDHGHGWGRGHDHSKGHRHHHAAELDPTLISNGLTLLAGSVLLLMERKRRHS